MQKKLLLKRGSSIIVNAIKKDKSTRLKKLILLLVVFFINQYGFSQCATQFTTTMAAATTAPITISSSISYTTPNNNGGRRNFAVSNMVAGNTYRVSNCGALLDTELTIYSNLLMTVVAYNNDNGSACTGTAPSIDFTPMVNGTYYMQLNKLGCLTTPNTSNGIITVTLLTNCTKPTTQATATAFTNNTTGTSLTANWTRGNGTGGVIVVARLTSVLAVAEMPILPTLLLVREILLELKILSCIKAPEIL